MVDILQPCVTFNKKNTYDWYRARVYSLPETGYDPGDRTAAFQKALEGGDRIPLGVIYRVLRPTYGDQVAALQAGPLASRELQRLTAAEIASLRAEFV
jgi:2-oxoglutarate ferredoxin oxidoreductase subunit beta